MNLLDFKRRPKLKIKQTLKSETRKVVRSLIITLGAMIVILSVIYLILINDSSQKGYTLTQTKLKNENLTSINTTLSTKLTQATAFSKIEAQEKIKKMHEIHEKQYVTNEDNTVK